MIWAEVSCEVADADSEMAANVMREAGAGGVAFAGPSLLHDAARRNAPEMFVLPDNVPAEGPTRVVAYFPVDDLLGERINEVRSGLDRAFAACGRSERPVISVDRLPDENWAEAWKVYYKADRISDRVVIVPSWIEYDARPGDVIVRLDPGAAFGTGQHESTRLAVQAIEGYLEPGMSFLDVGCGSGILSIVAVGLGASHAVGIDLDPVAVRVARENVQINHGADRVDIVLGDLASGVSGMYDLVVANILAEATARLAPDLHRVTARGGRFISSGMVKKSEGIAREAMEAAGQRIIGRLELGDWVALVSETDPDRAEAGDA